MRNRCIGSQKGIRQLAIMASVFFFLVLSNIMGPTIKKTNLDWENSFEVQESCLACGIGSFESIIDTLDILDFTENEGYERSLYISYTL